MNKKSEKKIDIKTKIKLLFLQKKPAWKIETLKVKKFTYIRLCRHSFNWYLIHNEISKFLKMLTQKNEGAKKIPSGARNNGGNFQN